MTVGEIAAAQRQRISELVGGLTPDGAATPVPTCPAWSVRDVVAHLSGTCADILAGNLGGAGTDPWTEAQVAARRDLRVAEIVQEWSELGPQVEALAGHFPGRSAQQWIADLTTHEHDIRTALGVPGARDREGIGIGLDYFVTAGLHSAVSARGLAPLAVRAGEQTWVVGTGAQVTTGDAAALERSANERLWAATLGSGPEAGSASGTLDAAGTLEASPFELFRALSGRRSAAQIRSWRWSVDPEPYLAAFAFGPFSTSPIDILE